MQFNTGASSYTLSNFSNFSFLGQGVLDQSVTTQMINNNGQLNFHNSSTAGDIQLTNSNSLNFYNSSSAGTAAIANSSHLSFNDNSTAGTAQIANTGNLTFAVTASAGNASIDNDSGLLTFSNNSSAAGASLANNGTLYFNDSSSAGNSSVTNTSNGGIVFNNNSTAASAQFANQNALIFNDQSSAGSAILITLKSLTFNGTSTAGNAVITNGDILELNASSSAATALVTTLAGAHTLFSQAAQGGSAQFITDTGGYFDISQSTAGPVSVGSIAGGGTYYLGGNDLTTGLNNLSSAVSGVISDWGTGEGTGGSLTKTGTGTLTLSGANSYTGGTTIAQGNLVVDTGGTLGTGGVNNQFNLSYIDNSVAGNNAITNTGTLTLSNSASGGNATVSNLGGVFLNNNATAGNASIHNGALGSMTFANNSTAGNANLTSQDGAGITIKFFDQSTAGNAVIYNGIGDGLTFDAQSTAGSANITNNGYVTFSGSSGPTPASAGNAVITNNNSVQFNGFSTAGNTLLTTNAGASVIFRQGSSGGLAQLTTNASGLVDFSFETSPVTVGSIAGSGSYNLGSIQLTTGGDNLSTTLSGTIQDGGINPGTGGSLIKVGAGSLVLSGANSYSGGTYLQGGTLAVGSASSLGTGSLWVDGGTLETYGGPLTLQVTKNYTQSAGGTLQLALNNGSQDALNAGGTASLGGPLSLVFGGGFTMAQGNSVTLVTASGVSGMFSQWTNPPGERLFPFYSPTQVTMESVIPSFVVAGLGSNGKSIAQALDSAFEDTARYSLIANLVSQPTSTLPSLYRQIDPSGITSAFQMGFRLARAQASLVSQTQDSLNPTEGGDNSQARKSSDVLFASTLPANEERNLARSPAPAELWNVSLKGYGDFETLSNDVNAAGYQFSVGGVMAMAEIPFGQGMSGGFLVGYGQGKATPSNGGELDLSSGEFGLFTGYQSQGFQAEAQAELGLNTYKIQQANLGGTASGSSTGQQYSIQAGLGYGMDLNGLKLEPFLSGQYVNVGLGSFQESGSSVPLGVPAQNENNTMSELGFKLGQPLVSRGWSLTPHLDAAWEHVYQGNQDSLSANLGSPIESFTVTGPAAGADAVLLGLGALADFSGGFSLYAEYQGRLGVTNVTEQSLSGGLGIGF
jgi:autotransporter-associated beta strand protein